MDRVGDGVEQVGLAQTGLPVDVEGVIAVPWIIGHRPGGGMGKLLEEPTTKRSKVYSSVPGKKSFFLSGLLVLVQFPFRKDHHVHLGGEQLPQGVLDLGDVPGGDDVPLEPGGE